ncbi:MAG: hypothetical protein Rubg2KO_31640 [Rubricoccaceae bacterium]
MPSLSSPTALDVHHRLDAVKATGLFHAETEEAFDRLARVARRALGGAYSLVSLLGADRQIAKGAAGVDFDEGAVRDGLCQFTVAGGVPFVVADTTADDRLQDLPPVRAGLRAYLGIPLILTDGAVVGSFMVGDTQTRDWSRDDVALLEDLAATAIAEISARTATRQRDAEHDRQLEGARAAARAAEALSHNRRRLNLALEATRMGTFEFDPATGHTTTDDQTLRLLGLDEAISPAELSERIHPEDREAFRQFVATNSEGGEGPDQITYCIRKPDGAERWIESSVRTHSDNDGARRVIGTLRDVTTQRESVQELRESEVRLRHILDGILAFVGILTPAGTLIETNRAALEVAGLQPDEVNGRPFWDTYWWAYDPAVQADLKAACERAARGEPSRYDTTVRVSDGQFISIDFAIAPVRDSTGAVTHLVPSGFDISKRVEAEASLRSAADHKTALLELVQRQRATPDPDAMLAATAEAVGRHLGAHRAGFVELADGALDFDASPQWTDGPLEPIVGQHPASRLGSKYLDRTLAGETVRIEDTATSPLTTDSGLPSTGAQGVLSVPVLRDGEWVTGLYVHHAAPRAWTDDEANFVREAAEQTWDAVERVRAQQAQAESDERYRTLFESVEVGVCVLDVLYDDEHPVDYRFVETNSAFVEQTGLEDAIGKTAYELVPDLEPHWVQTYAEVARTGVPVRFESGSDAMGRWFDVSAVRVGTTGSPRVALFFSDITETRQREAQLRASEGRFRGTFENAAVGIAHVGRSGEWIRVNERLCEIVGYAPDELLTKTFQDITHPEDLDIDLGYLRRLLAGEIDRYEMEKRYLHREGHLVWVQLTVAPSRSPEGEIEYLISIVEDISDRKAAEQALAESEARFRQLAEALPVIVYTTDAEGRVVYLNRQWFEYTGQPPDIELTSAQTAAVHPDDNAAIVARWGEAQEAGEPLEADLRIRRHDGAYRWFRTRVVPVTDADGVVVRWFGGTTDIHANKVAEAELTKRVAERTAELERSNAELDQFAYVASHDLRAPLRAIDNLAAWIEEDVGEALPEASARHLELLRGRAERMEGLLDGLLAYSRAGRVEGTPEPIDVRQLVEDVVELVSLPGGLAVEALGDFPKLVSPRAPLELVVRNLVGNAIKHHDRPDTGRVAVSAHAEGPWAVFTVTDDGPGIAPEYHERVFGLFQTLRPRDEVEGSGMGLSIVRKTVESRGGTVSLRSEGRGTALSFTWPLQTDA